MYKFPLFLIILASPLQAEDVCPKTIELITRPKITEKTEFVEGIVVVMINSMRFYIDHPKKMGLVHPLASGSIEKYNFPISASVRLPDAWVVCRYGSDFKPAMTLMRNVGKPRSCFFDGKSLTAKCEYNL
jgi:hypothetical protein